MSKMRRLTEYLENSNQEFYEDLNPFEQHILQHIYIDYKTGHANTCYNIYEDYAEYHKLDDLVKDISTKIYVALQNMRKTGSWTDMYLDYSESDFKNIDNIFFDEIEIHIGYSNNIGANYDNNNAKINPKTYQLNIIQIEYFHNKSNQIDFYKIKNKITHEMLHAYDDYKSLIENGHLFDISKELLKKISILNINNENERYLRGVLYFTMDIEQHAFENELIDELEQHKEEIKNPNDALNVIRSSDIFKVYQNFLVKVNGYKKGLLSNEDAEYIANTYNEIFDTDYSTDKVFSLLEKTINDSIKRFEGIIGQLCLEHLNNIHVKIHHDRMIKDILEMVERDKMVFEN